MAYDPKNDPYAFFEDAPHYPGGAGKLAVLSDTVDLARYPKAIVMLIAGNVSYIPAENENDVPISFVGLPAGWVSPHRVRRVMVTGTTAAAVATIDE